MSRFFHLTLSSIVLGGILLSAWGMTISGITLQWEQLLPKLRLYAIVLAGTLFYRWRGEPRFVAAFMIIFWMGVVSDLHVFPMFLAGRQPAEFYDVWLARADQWLGLEVPQVLAWLEPYPPLADALHRIYYTLVFLMAAALLITTLTNQIAAAQEYVISCVASVLICFPFFACFQAYGPWVAYGFSPNPAQQSFMDVFAALKRDEPFVMDLGYVNGLLCFPSFHTILAVLPAAALRHTPYVRWIAALWAALIVVSTVTTGWHYIVDVLAGLAVAGCCVLVAKGFTALERRCCVPTAASLF